MADPSTDTPTLKPLEEIRAEDLEVDDEDEETKKKKELEKTIWTRLAEGLAIASAVLAVLAIVFSGASAITIVAGLIAIGVGGLVIYQQELLQDTDTLRRVQNEIRKEVNKLQEENDTLHGEVDKMEGAVSNLKESETKLGLIADEQGSNVSSLVSLVKENGEIQKQMIDITKAETLQRLFDVILQSDRDGNFKIGEFEARELLFRLKVDPRVEIDEDNLKARIAGAGGEISVRDLTEDIMSAKREQEGDHIFSFKPENA
mmetsp:Transcript_22230/g.36808  ORF Transcript_22230/g.36808 Transcript_22230/m.36808 type:complete len:260 (-) Transcript_22230:226-1005(-)|eukprot:CAMPEP_0119014044 /NCGR_PEP_ID=MMETSP1176-20130426/9323_1 /TAXON_ID=265551 /ORGANISM="Synedropsis recta cf, Strain CCMP1620" /LENGTH=259 /DNA_ID=CAMNT_0006967179 /DNA_START=34 /DNA_END=813 /DNA_ORIENTATION=-